MMNAKTLYRYFYNKMVDNKSNVGRKYEVMAKSDDATILIYDEIGPWGIDAQKIVTDMQSIKVKCLNVRFNSIGGSVFDGVTIQGAIKRNESKQKIAHIDGLAASIATIIMLGADRIVAAENSMIMIHQPWSMVAGDAATMRKEAEVLDKVTESIIDQYVIKTGKSRDQIKEWMDAETWFSAKEALENGFIDEIVGSKLKNESLNLFDLSIFTNVPKNIGLMSPTIRDCEQALRDAGCSANRAKEILAVGYSERGRDVHEDQVTKSEEPEVENVVNQAVDQVVDVVVPKVNSAIDPVADLLIRAEMLAPSNKKSIIKAI